MEINALTLEEYKCLESLRYCTQAGWTTAVALMMGQLIPGVHLHTYMHNYGTSSMNGLVNTTKTCVAYWGIEFTTT